jgi:hypothetical protein
MRRVEVPLNVRLARLHLVMQAAMGWENCHLWEFRVRGVGFGPPDPDDGFPGPLNAAKATLRLVLEDTGAKTLKYLYDFGDGWEHTLKVERILGATPGLDLPLLDPSALTPNVAHSPVQCTRRNSRPVQCRS